MGVTCRVQYAGAGVGHMGNDRYEIEVIHELDGFLTAAFQSERNHTTRAVGQVFLTQSIVLVGGKTAVVDPCNMAVLLEPFGHFLRVRAMLLHAEVERLQS